MFMVYSASERESCLVGYHWELARVGEITSNDPSINGSGGSQDEDPREILGSWKQLRPYSFYLSVRNTAKKRRSFSESETDAVWQPEKVGSKGVRNSVSGRKSPWWTASVWTSHLQLMVKHVIYTSSTSASCWLHSISQIIRSWP